MILQAVALLLLLAAIGLAALVFKLMRERDRTKADTDVMAARRFELWKAQEIESQRSQLLDLARKEALVSLEGWKQETEAQFRKDAVMRSQSVTLGKVSEHMAPYMPEFAWNPKDARFIGSPIDFLVFDGLDDGLVQEVIFIEVKTASSGLSTRQRQIRDVIQAGRVVWHEMRIEG